ncbi:unnamed protein product [Dracunculus medinensis]|uniref:Succinate dehydrogenase assembly factor 4, mitochondrial n=1 Tax=Dracunculus medinensis TaxID=318479 RepID=A0A0N4U6Q6_DRAME|nr:unnamed protein product [Dracunculus medinensis]
MSSLLFISTRPLTQNVMIRILSMRSASATAVPPPAKIQLPKPKEPGHIQYQRFWSRDKRYKPQVPGDTPARLLFGRLGHAYEIYPLLFLGFVWFCGFLVISYTSLSKIEVWIDRS